jgi:hypothetical protein
MPNVNKIVASPNLKCVTPGAKITYYCLTEIDTTSKASDIKYQWYCYYDRAMARAFDKPYVEEGPAEAVWPEAKWTFPGRHTIKCQVTFPNRKPFFIEYPQWVDRAESVIGQVMLKQFNSKLPHPDTEYSVICRYIETLKRAAQVWPMRSPIMKIEHEERVAQLEQYRDKFADRLESTEGKGYIRIPIYAAHINHETQEQMPLRVFICKVSPKGSSTQQWHLVDWTNPMDRRLTGVYEGEGRTAKEAIQEAVKAWAGEGLTNWSGNRYYPGTVQYSIPDLGLWHKSEPHERMSGFFETTGSNDWDNLREFIGLIAKGAFLAGIVASVILAPGSQIAAGLIWASVFSSAVESGINIGQRTDEGFNNWNEDAIDTLNIVGSIFAVGGLAAGWAKGAQIITETQHTGMAKFVFVGRISTDGANGVLLLANQIKEYDEITRDLSLSPEERTIKLLKLFATAAIEGGMTYVSIKGTARDLKNLNAAQTNRKLKEIGDPSKTIDTTERPVAEGHTKDEQVLTRTQDEHLREPVGELPQSARKRFPEPPDARERGMRPKDDLEFEQLAKEEDKIIIVRDSNKAASGKLGQNGVEAKPMEAKEKTIKDEKSEFYGYSAADPKDIYKDLEKGVINEEYLDDLWKRGFRLGDPAHPANNPDLRLTPEGRKLREQRLQQARKQDYVLRDSSGNVYTSDYDLHGVYNTDGTNAWPDDGPGGSNSLRARMNTRFDEPLVRHGPHDRWEEKTIYEKAKVNYGPKPPVTAYTPNGKVHLKTKTEMEAFYRANGIDWDGLYGNIDWEKWKKYNPGKY